MAETLLILIIDLYICFLYLTSLNSRSTNCFHSFRAIISCFGKSECVSEREIAVFIIVCVA